MELCRVEHLSFTYPDAAAPALRDVSFSLRAGEFVTLCGLSGSGKSTLLRQLKSALAPHGTRSGAVYFDGRALADVPLREQAARIGLVQQSVENQLVTDRVWHELAFGLESLGLETAAIRRRVAESAGLFGLEPLFRRETATLSGGQKQLVSLAAVLAMQPELLLLDEPTAQLDPIAAADFLATLARLCRSFGTTVLLSEQRLEEALPLSDRALVLSGGRLVADGTPAAVGAQLRERGDAMFFAMPAAMRVWAAAETGGAPCPVSVREGRTWLEGFAAAHTLAPVPPRAAEDTAGETVAELSEIHFRYAREDEDVLRGASLTVRRGELLALLGGNGAGKTTLLHVLAGTRRAYRGVRGVSVRTALLPQEVQTLFAKETVRDDLAEVGASAADCAEAAALCRLEGLLDRHPYDLSGGEQQRAALAKVLLTRPELLLLDEPTRGLDAAFKQELAAILAQLRARGTAVVMVSHDIEFCAEHATRCALLFDGAVIAEGTPRDFLADGSCYTTAVSRMARGVAPEALTVPDLIAVCGGAPERMEERRDDPPPPPPVDTPPREGERMSEEKPQRGVSRASLLALALIPLTLFAGRQLLGDRGYYAVSLLMALEALAAVFLAFEGRKPAARELVVLAVLCALGVAGRAAFFMLPQCKPVLALTVLTGAALGGEAGFLVGAVTMLVSNLLFSQGPWTPWQMLGMGLCGLLAGVSFRRGALPQEKWTLAPFGAVCALAVYGVLLNASSALLATGALTWASFLAYCSSGIPMDCVHAAATLAFLLLFTDPLLARLTRVRKKHSWGR